jgi:hypothetical protein
MSGLEPAAARVEPTQVPGNQLRGPVALRGRSDAALAAPASAPVPPADSQRSSAARDDALGQLLRSAVLQRNGRERGVAVTERTRGRGPAITERPADLPPAAVVAPVAPAPAPHVAPAPVATPAPAPAPVAVVSARDVASKQLAAPTLGPSGRFYWAARFDVVPPTFNGWLIQKVASGFEMDIGRDPSPDVDAIYWEGWRVRNGKVFGGDLKDLAGTALGHGSDELKRVAQPLKSKGRWMMDTALYLIEGLTPVPAGLNKGGAKAAKELLATTTEPDSALLGARLGRREVRGWWESNGEHDVVWKTLDRNGDQIEAESGEAFHAAPVRVRTLAERLFAPRD